MEDYPSGSMLPEPVRPNCLDPILHLLGQLRVEIQSGLPLDLPNAGEELGQRLIPGHRLWRDEGQHARLSVFLIKDDAVEEVRNSLLASTYDLKPVRKLEIPKSGGGTRVLGIPTVLDRVRVSLVPIMRSSLEARSTPPAASEFVDPQPGFRQCQDRLQQAPSTRLPLHFCCFCVVS